MPERLILKVTHTPLFYCKHSKKALQVLLVLRVIRKSNQDSKIRDGPTEWQHSLWGSVFRLSSETQRSILIHPLPHSGMCRGGHRDSLGYLTTAMSSSRRVILETFFLKRKWFFICKQCNNSLDRNQNNAVFFFVSHQPLLMSLQQETKSTKMFVPLCPIQLKYLKTFTLSVQRGSGVETIERNTQI